MNHDDEHDRGLAHDLETLRAMDRRGVLRLLAGASLVPLFACSEDDSTGGTGTTTPPGGSTTPGGTTECSKIPEETAGPYPGDGSNGPNILVQSGVVRSDIRSSIGTATGTAAGIPLTIKLTIVNASADCAALGGYAVYLWHCDRDGKYSMYDIADQNYLRGVQETADDGTVTFTSIFPACYSGRWPHIHFEVYPSAASATASGNKIATSQLAMPEDVCNTAFATTGYEASVSNFANVDLATDNVFSDGSTTQLATVTGDATNGFVASLTVGVSA